MGGFAAGEHVDTDGRHTFKTQRLFGVALVLPDKCIFKHFTHLAHLVKFKILRLNELLGDILRLMREGFQ